MRVRDPLARQFPTALVFALRNQARNRLAWMLLAGFVPAWYTLMAALITHEPLDYRLFSTGATLRVDGRHLGLITAGMNSLTLITGFAVFAAIRRALPLDRRLVFAGYRQSRLIAAKTLATVIVATVIAAYASLVLLAFWRPSPAGWAAVLAGFAVMAIEYGALGLLLGVLVKGDLEGFFLIIMGGLVDTFLQNPVGNPVANKPLLAYFPSFGPMQFASGGPSAAPGSPASSPSDWPGPPASPCSPSPSFRSAPECAATWLRHGNRKPPPPRQRPDRGTPGEIDARPSPCSSWHSEPARPSKAQPVSR